MKQGISMPYVVVAAAALACRVSAQIAEQPPQPATVPQSASPSPRELAPEIAEFWVRPGYELTVAVPQHRGARFLEFDDRGTLFVSRPDPGDITAFFDDNGDGVFERSVTFVADRPSLHGLHWHAGWLWFTTTGSIHKARDTDHDGKADEVVDVITQGLPSGGGHWWRSIFVTDDGFFTSIGDTGNINDERDTDRQKIWRFDLDGKNRKLWSSGIRNTEKLRYRPGSNELWGVDHGSDWFGARYGERPGIQPITNLNPPDEFNLYLEGGFYGHPFITGSRVPRPEFADRPDIRELAEETVPPEWAFGSHWAANGWCWIDPEVNRTARHPFPSDHEGDAFIACRGSWNSSAMVGYCVLRVLFDENRPTGGPPRPYGSLVIVKTSDLETTFARPVDCVQAPDGSVLWSSDVTGRVYRIRAKADVRP